jgi:endonuclease YncB( thermonuclease family)
MILISLVLAAASPAVSGCVAIDGDTLRCGRERVRLLAIDAPELGRCAPGRRCVPGDPRRARATLAEAVDRSMRIERIGQDRYGRTLALVRSRKGDLSCWQLRQRSAMYRRDWDQGARVARLCVPR